MTPLPALRSAADAFAVETAHRALAEALKAIDNAYKTVEDARLEDLLTGITEAMENAQGDLVVMANQIHDDEADARRVYRWLPRYRAA